MWIKIILFIGFVIGHIYGSSLNRVQNQSNADATAAIETIQLDEDGHRRLDSLIASWRGVHHEGELEIRRNTARQFLVNGDEDVCVDDGADQSIVTVADRMQMQQGQRTVSLTLTSVFGQLRLHVKIEIWYTMDYWPTPERSYTLTLSADRQQLDLIRDDGQHLQYRKEAARTVRPAGAATPGGNGNGGNGQKRRRSSSSSGSRRKQPGGSAPYTSPAYHFA